MRRPFSAHLFPIVASGLLSLALTQTASAQSQSLFGNRGPAALIGSNAAGTPVGNGFTTGRVDATASGSGGILGLTGQTVGGGLGTTPMGGTTTGAAGAPGAFVGRDDTAGRFVGDQRVGQQTGGARRTGAAGGRQFGNRGGAGGTTGQAFGDDSPIGGRNGQRTQRIIRPRQEVAFTYPQRSTTTIATTLNGRIDRISLRRPALQSVAVVLDAQGVATLRGQVASEEVKKLAAIMARLEPGVRSVENELTIGPAVGN